ncbi:MAG: hypothetical protein ABIO86_17055 [Sphingomonas sp.]
MSYLRLAGLLGGIGVAIAALIWITTTIGKAHQVDAFRACSKAATSPGAALDACDKTIKPIVEAARRADLCETALQAGDSYAITMTCSEQVKRIGAELDAAQANLDDAQKTIAGDAATLKAAVTRAEARSTTTAARKAADDKTIQTAPRLGDGRVHCDAECLRSLAGS